MRRLLGFLVAVAACDALIGLERFPPLAAPPDASTDAPLDAGRGDAFCAAATGSYFCEDFDDPSAPFPTRWKGASFVDFPYRQGDAAGGVVSAPFYSPPNAFELSAQRGALEDAPSYVLHHVLAKGVVDASAIELRARVKLLESIDGRDAAADADADADADASLPLTGPRFGVLGIVVNVNGKFDGAQLVITDRSLLLLAGSLVAGSSISKNQASLGAFKVLDVSKQGWLEASICIGEREAVVRRAREGTEGRVAECPPAPIVAAAWLSLGPLACIALDPAIGRLQDSPVMPAVGLLVADPGAARVAIDDVRLDPVR